MCREIFDRFGFGGYAGGFRLVAAVAGFVVVGRPTRDIFTGSDRFFDGCVFFNADRQANAALAFEKRQKQNALHEKKRQRCYRLLFSFISG